MKKAGVIIGMLAGFWAILLTPSDSYAQAQDSTVYRIVTNDGNQYVGTIVDENALEILFKTKELGEITIKRISIHRMEKLKPGQVREDGYWFDNPHATRYLFGTNALGLEAGEGYYQNTWIFFNNVNMGLSDRFSMGIGFVPAFLFGADALPVWLLPKASIPIANDKLHLAAGGLFGGIIGSGSVGFGFSYGVMTVGNSDKNVSLGLGYGYADGEWSGAPFVNLSGMLRISQKTYLITENYFFSVGDDNTGIVSAAVRWSPENFAVDFGLFRPMEEVEMIGIPWLGVTLPFGK